VNESQELPYIRKWIFNESGQDVFIGIANRFSIVGIGGFLGLKVKFRFTKVARDCALPHDIGPERGQNIVLSQTH
jgi:hypothetical protein